MTAGIAIMKQRTPHLHEGNGAMRIFLQTVFAAPLPALPFWSIGIHRKYVLCKTVGSLYRKDRQTHYFADLSAMISNL